MDRSKDWLKQAERDLAFAETAAASKYHEWAAFCAQQGAEKAVKALVQFLHGAARGHSITKILKQLPVSVRVPEDLLNVAQELDKAYIAPRYPNAFDAGSPADYFNEKNSRELIGYARRILEFCRSQIH